MKLPKSVVIFRQRQYSWFFRFSSKRKTKDKMNPAIERKKGFMGNWKIVIIYLFFTRQLMNLGWGSGSWNTENTGKYWSSILLNTENVQYWNFNTIEYWKCSICTEISILLNIENVQYRIFNTIEYRKKFQSRTSIIPKIIFNISPHPNLYLKKSALRLKRFSFLCKFLFPGIF